MILLEKSYRVVLPIFKVGNFFVFLLMLGSIYRVMETELRMFALAWLDWLAEKDYCHNLSENEIVSCLTSIAYALRHV